MRIPNVNDSGFSSPKVYTGGVNTPLVDATGIATQNLGRDVGRIGLQVSEIQARDDAQMRRQTDELARAKAANDMLDYELQVKTAAQDISDKVKTGEIDYNLANQEYQDKVSQIPQYQRNLGDPVLDENFQRGMKRVNFSAQMSVDSSVKGARQADARSQMMIGLDKLGKQIGLAGTSVEDVNARADLLRKQGQEGGLSREQIDKTLQDFKDNNWFNQAQQTVLQSGNDMGALQDVLYQVTSQDGFYADKLDPNKRTSLARSISGQIEVLQNREIHLADKRDAKAQQAMNEIDKQIASGIPATPQQWQDWKNTTQGTSFEQQFFEQVNDEKNIQELLRKPLDVQAAYISQQQQDMALNGADLRQQNNFNRLKNAFNANQKLLTEQPLQFAQNRMGIDIPPMNFTNLPELASQMKDRYATVSALSKQYGPQVALNPFLPQESEQIKTAFNKADDTAKIQLLSVLASSAPNGAAYASTIKSIASDNPVLLMAGMANYRGFKTPEGVPIAPLMLDGERILKDKSTVLPNEAAMQSAFSDAIGMALPQGSPQRQQAYTAFKTLYAGISNQKGKVYSKEEASMVDSDIAELAMQATTGGISDYNGAKVIRPYGMDDNVFSTNINVALNAVSERTGFDLTQIQDMPLLAVPGQEGKYFLLNGVGILPDTAGAPIIIDANTSAARAIVNKTPVKEVKNKLNATITARGMPK